MKSHIKIGMSDKTLTDVSKAIFTSLLTINYLHEIRFTPYYNKKLKQSLNRVVSDLEEAEKKEFSLVYETAEDETCELSEAKNDLITEIANLGPLHYEFLTDIIRDYKKNHQNLVEENKIIHN